MGKETELKIQTAATSAMKSMIGGLVDPEEEDNSDINIANK